MARIETWFKCNLKGPVIVHKMETGLFSQDSQGNLIGVEVYNDNGPVTLSGSVNGYCILANGTTIPIAGTRMTSAGNKHKVYIILPQNAYSVPGVIQITIKLTDGNAITTLACCVGYMMQSRTPNQESPSGQTITDWTNQITAMMQAVDDAIDSIVLVQDSQPTDPGNKLWIRETPGEEVVVPTYNEFTIAKTALVKNTGNEIFEFTNGKYIKDNGGVGTLVDLTLLDGASTNNVAVIDVTPGEYFTINGTGGNQGRLWCFVDSRNITLSVAASSITGTDLIIVAPENAAKLILNVNGEYGLNCRGKYTTSVISENKNALQSNFHGKKISIIGDSIDTFNQVGYKIEGYRMAYPMNDVYNVEQTWWKIVADNAGAKIEVNASWSGSRATNTHSDPTYPDFYDRVSLLGNPDVIFVALGVNDYRNSVRLGYYNFDGTYSSLSESEFRPAYIKGIKALKANYPNAEIVCIAESMGNEYRDSIAKIAETLGAIFIDAGYYTTGSDGVHPDAKGMRMIASEVLYPTDKKFKQEYYSADAKYVGEEISSLKDSIAMREIGTFHQSYQKETSYVEGADRFYFFACTEIGKKYRINLKVNSIPTSGENDNRVNISTRNVTASTGDGEQITGELNGVLPDEEFSFDFSPIATRGYIQLYVRSETGNVDIVFSVYEIINTHYETDINYKRVAYMEKNISTSQRMFFPYIMKAGKQYHLRVFADTVNAEIQDDLGPSINYGVISADTLIGSADTYDVHNNILKISGYPYSDLTKSGKVKQWFYYDYTAVNDTDYIELYMNYCGIGSKLVVEIADNDHHLADYVYLNDFSICNHNNRMIYDTKHYPFKRIGGYTGSGQGIIERYGDIFVFTNGTMYRYNNLYIVSTSSLFDHPINASLMKNGNIMISDISDYNTENEVRHVYEYDPDTDTIINDYAPVVEGKRLVLSEEIDSGNILVAYKNVNEQAGERIIFWYSYSIENDEVTYISETQHDRIYTQGCSLRGGLVYVMTNNITTSINSPAKLLVVELTSGTILNEIVLPGFGETEGFFISYSEAPGTYAFMLDNGDHYIYLVKLV